MIVLKNVHRTEGILDTIRKRQGNDVADALDIMAEEHLVEHLKDYFYKYGFDAVVEVKDENND